MSILTIEKTLDYRKKLHPNDDYGIEECREKLIDELSENEEMTMEYLTSASKENINYTSEVFEEVSEKLQSKAYIGCLRRIDEKFPELDLTDIIDLAEDFIVD